MGKATCELRRHNCTPLRDTHSTSMLFSTSTLRTQKPAEPSSQLLFMSIHVSCNISPSKPHSPFPTWNKRPSNLLSLLLHTLPISTLYLHSGAWELSEHNLGFLAQESPHQKYVIVITHIYIMWVLQYVGILPGSSSREAGLCPGTWRNLCLGLMIIKRVL